MDQLKIQKCSMAKVSQQHKPWTVNSLITTARMESKFY